MNKFDVQIALEGVNEAAAKWKQATAEYQQGRAQVLNRLIHEAARAFMGPTEFARAAGMSVKQVRDLMRRNGLNPANGKRALSDLATKALVGNAELLGIEPHEMDLTSPLAYLPMGDQMRRDLQEQTNAPVTEVFLETENEARCRAATGDKCNVCRLNNTWVNERCVNILCDSNAKARIASSIYVGIAAEEDWDGPSIKPGTLTDEQVAWLASWLAGDGIK